MDSNRFVRIKSPEKRPETKQETKVDLSLPVLKRASARGKLSKGMSLPPEIQTTAQLKHVFRFYCNSAITTLVTITGTNLAGICGGICSIANSAVRAWASSYKVHRVSVWPAGSGLSVPEIVWLSPVAATIKDDCKVASLPSGVTVTQAVHSRPPTGSLAAKWCNVASTLSNGIFELANCPQGSIIDVEISFTLGNVYGSNAISVATSTLGLIYYLGLLNNSVAIPVGLPTTL